MMRLERAVEEEAGPAVPQRVAEWMLPLPLALPAFASAASARRRLREEALGFLLVVAPGTGRLLGAVDRESLDARPCCQCRHGRCAVVRHLGPDVHFCFPDEEAADVLEAEAELARRGKVPARRRIPLFVVDEELKPLGIFSPTAADAAAEPLATAPRAA